MDEITNAEELRAWLKDRPREDAVLIAARCALRVFPLLALVIENNPEERRGTIILPTCRAMAVACVAGTWPAQATGLAGAAAAAEETANTAAHYANAATYPYPSDAHANAVAHATAHAAVSVARVTYAEAEYAAPSVADAVPYYAADAAYAAVSEDAALLEQGTEHKGFANRRLWPEKIPDEIKDAWQGLRDHMLNAEDDWFVWVDWYQDRLEGKPANEELEVAKALIPNEIWEAGPATVNAEIARLIAEHELEQQSDPTESDVDDDLRRQLAASELFAESDFEHQPEPDHMVAVPFEDDVVPVGDDPFRLRDRADFLSTLSDLANDLFNDLKVDQPQVPPSLRRDIHRYGRECALDVELVRPRRLVSLAVALQRALQDEDNRLGLGNYLLAKLEDLMVQHNSLIGSYYVTILDRARVLHDHALPEDFEPEEIEDKLEQADQMVKSADWATLPALPTEYPELIEAQREALKEMCQFIDLKPEAEVRARLKREVEECYLTLGSSMARLIVRTVEAAGSSKRVAGTAGILGKSTAALSLAGGILKLLGLL